MNSGSENGALGLSGRTDAIHTSRSGDAKGNARTSTVLTTANTALVAPIVSASGTDDGQREAWPADMLTERDTEIVQESAHA